MGCRWCTILRFEIVLYARVIVGWIVGSPGCFCRHLSRLFMQEADPMTRTVRVLTRSMLALVTVLTLAAALAQPAPLLRAQEDPLPTPTVSTTEATVGAPASSEPQIAIVNADGSVTYPADSALSSEIA